MIVTIPLTYNVELVSQDIIPVYGYVMGVSTFKLDKAINTGVWNKILRKSDMAAYIITVFQEFISLQWGTVQAFHQQIQATQSGYTQSLPNAPTLYGHIGVGAPKQVRVQLQFYSKLLSPQPPTYEEIKTCLRCFP